MPERTLRRFLARHDAALNGLCRGGFALCILTVTVLSLLPQAVMPKVGISDKVSHFIAYTAIAAFGLLGYRTAAVRIAIGVIGLGGAIEVGQIFVPGRSAEILDFIADIGGVAAGLVLARLLLRRWPKAGTSAPDAAPRD
jgi:VanZ family protein